ncbi:MAG TPA: hypothetical protein VFW00_06565 [Rhodocyclaceae bacterium]|nr:hypothetical protein [Rhodocyclaceae bacterium]
MAVTANLTGKTRHRIYKPLFGRPLLVLQVEEHREGYSPGEMAGDGCDVDYSFWRDATAEDITTKAKS